MNQSIELLRDVVRTARDGDEGIRLVMEKTRDTAFREALFSEQEQYQAIERDAGRRLVDLGTQAEPEPKKECWLKRLFKCKKKEALKEDEQ